MAGAARNEPGPAEEMLGKVPAAVRRRVRMARLAGSGGSESPVGRQSSAASPAAAGGPGIPGATEVSTSGWDNAPLCGRSAPPESHREIAQRSGAFVP